jgi:anti-sigma regulatory factor (Ser/Thr protein kinase)
MGSLALPGQPEHLRAARAFVAHALSGNCADTDTMVLLVSELVSNSLQHSDSRHPGGMITITLIATPDGVRAEIADEGGSNVPVLHPALSGRPELAETGRGLQLVDELSARWSYNHDQCGTVTWFELADAALATGAPRCLKPVDGGSSFSYGHTGGISSSSSRRHAPVPVRT